MICTGNVDDIPEYKKSIHNLSRFISDLHLSEDQNSRLIELVNDFHTQTARAAFSLGIQEYDKAFDRFILRQEIEADNDF